MSGFCCCLLLARLDATCAAGEGVELPPLPLAAMLFATCTAGDVALPPEPEPEPVPRAMLLVICTAGEGGASPVEEGVLELLRRRGLLLLLSPPAFSPPANRDSGTSLEGCCHSLRALLLSRDEYKSLDGCVCRPVEGSAWAPSCTLTTHCRPPPHTQPHHCLQLPGAS